MGISLVTEQEHISIPFVDEETGCSILYSVLLDKKDLPIKQKEICPNWNDMDWEMITNRAVNRETLVSVVQDFRDKVKADGNSVESAQKLYKWLIKPIKSFIDRLSNTSDLSSKPINTHLSFILDPSIGSFPIAALEDEEKRFLIEKFSVSFMPSFSLLNSSLS
jgi:CHAT domain-containing protein